MKRFAGTRGRTLLYLALTIALLAAVSAFSTPLPAAAGEIDQLPSSISSSCSARDSTRALSNFLDTVPANSTVILPAHGCFIINETLLLRSTTGLTINGNGSTLEQTVSPETPAPLLELWDDSDLTIENLTIRGHYTGTNGGEGFEGDYGIQFEADSGVTLTHDTVSNVQGDFLYLSPPYDVTSSDELSTDISITHSVFTNAGYHGLTVESVGCPTLAPCNGLTVSYDIFNGIGTDAMDFEYDQYSTPFNPDGSPFWAAEDDVTIENNIWEHWGNDWFASLQGQTPGVQEQHLTLANNKLRGDGPLFEVVGTDPRSTSSQYTNTDWTIANNKFAAGFYGEPYRGGTSVAGQLYNISDLDIMGNTFPLCASTYEAPQPVSECAAPDQFVFDLNVITGGTIENNNFSGSLGVVQPQPYNQALTGLTQDDNNYGAARSN